MEKTEGEPSMIREIVGVCLLAIAPVTGYAESALEFEVASIKPAAPKPPGRIQISMGGDPGRINYTSVSLKNLIERAYSMKSYQVSGPDWMDSERFDVAAKLPEGARQSDVPVMLQALLAERFKLTIHREQKSMPVYAIVVGKSGVKMPKVEGDARPGPGPGTFRMQMGAKGRQLTGMATIDNLAGMLSRMLDRPVIDATELKDTYDLNLEWAPDEREGGMRMMAGVPVGDHPPASESSDSTSAPSLFAAVQEQLGLKLDPRKGQVDIVVVDSVEKAPTHN
jgi:uncharacterized protein (TIGR03435 family)